MKVRNKILLVIMTIMLSLQLQACSLNKQITTDSGVVLSQELTEVTHFIARVKGIYITIGTVVGGAYDKNYITKEEFIKIVAVAEKFRLNLQESKAIMLSWYDTEESKVLLNREKLKEEAIKLLLNHLDELVLVVVESEGMTIEDKQVIEAAYSMLSTIYSTGGTK